MHVVMTVNSAWNIYNFRRPVLDFLMRQGHRVSILAPFDDTIPKLEALGCRCIALKMDVKGLSPLKDFFLMRYMRRIFAIEEPDVVLSYTIKNNIFGAMAARSLGIPFIPNVSGLGTAFLSGGFIQNVAERLYRHAFQGLTTVFFQNSDDRDLFVSRGLVNEPQAKLLPGSGIDLRYFYPAPMPSHTGPTSFLMIGRLLRDKGVIEYVEAARTLRAKSYNARFRLLGASDAKNRTAISGNDVQRWVKEGIIEYLGEVSDVRPYIAAADCIVLPSYREGAPRTLIEAAAMARPLIATDVPGCKDVVADKISGFLCAARDSGKLAATLEAFLAMPAHERMIMGQEGRRRMEQYYDQRHVVSAYEAAIWEALDQ